MADILPLADRLCSASASGNLPEVLLLLQNGAAVNGLNTFKRTALQVVKVGSTAVVEALLEAGADPNLRDPVLGLTVTHDAAREGFADTLRALLAHGADANLADVRGKLPLHSAAKRGRVDAVRVLLGATADPLKVNRDGQTAEQLALLHGWNDTAACIHSYLGSTAVKNQVQQMNSELAIILGGLTKELQPLDIGVNRVF
ncbi:cyclin-dependent kinase 4 inhibitor C isoform X2 [Phyllopteryx taeniolatus]|uniref:cyclin-dependent kinase 4 inhibitor C isoform X2 n=2 Tax=Phyllopteryx taeniolatus TaxID=161469 RepID=UPI002AD496B7|nr:cyclin-dependent kinase 4 inhibitor C isoform X2 [Phyllopteryx taeniolatus]